MDYVKRGKPKKRRNNNNQGGKVPWLAIAIALAAILGFAAFLISVQGSAQQNGGATPTQSAAATKPKPTIPPMPEEKWHYFEELKHKEVEVEVPDQPLPDKPYQMQCGSFRNQADAEKMKARIALDAGLPSTIFKTSGDNGVWYRVVLGPYPRIRQAQSDLNLLRSKVKISNCPIWQWTWN